MILIWILNLGVVVEKILIKIPHVGYLRYDHLNRILKQNNLAHQILEVIPTNAEGIISLSLISLCHCIAESCEEDFI